MISNLNNFVSNIKTYNIDDIIINVNKYYDFISVTYDEIKNRILEHVLTFQKEDKLIFYNNFFIKRKLYNFSEIFNCMYSNIDYYYECNFNIIEFLDSIDKLDTIYEQYKKSNNENLIMYYLFIFNYEKYNEYIIKYDINKSELVQIMLKIYLQFEERNSIFLQIICKEIKTIDFKSHEIYNILNFILNLEKSDYISVLNIFRKQFLKINDDYININTYLEFYYIDTKEDIDIFKNLLDNYKIVDKYEYYRLICSVMVSTNNTYIKYYINLLNNINIFDIDDMFIYFYKNYLDCFEKTVSDEILLFFIKNGLDVDKTKTITNNYVKIFNIIDVRTNIFERLNMFKRTLSINKILK